ncbi:hypothetical protein F53441_5300 [Fusarium austroafricanum]|uniref:Zn(2)-C6 fungal-type domain-containing protein n=1 Tax=Fusarium austroafricanum TaxID=2364996 RepID=A0A8H4KL23_9HYPO|nr:hypothetical protein F53441_5300 [Fusarium austroafricanum]
MASNSNTLPQGFSVFQPALGAHLQFFPAIGTRELDDLVNAYIPGPASTQEKRASISLDYLEYAHLTGQTFKFYPVFTLPATVDSPATASPLQDSGYGSSFNTSPVTSNWDWSNVNTTTSSRRSSPKSTSSHQPADFSNLPGMKIMTKDGRDVTNSASRGSKTKEQRDHAHLMRIIKACDSCKKKKIRCDPSHKKRGVSSTAAQPAKVTKKTKTAAPEAKVAPVVAQDAFAQLSFPEQDFTADLDSLTASIEPGTESWEQFIQYPVVDDSYDFFNDPEGYFSPESSSSLSEDSTKPHTPTTEQDLYRHRTRSDAELAELTGLTVPAAYLPFNQTEANHDYVDFNLYSPESSFSEDERMVPIEISKQWISQPRSPAPNPLPPNEISSGFNSSGGEQLGGGEQTGDLFGAQFVASSAPQPLSTHGQLGREDVHRDPGAGPEYYSDTPTSSLGSDLLSSNSSLWSDLDSPAYVSGLLSSVDNQLSTNTNSVDTLLSTNSNVRILLIIRLLMEWQLIWKKVTIRRDIIEARGVTTAQSDSRRIETTPGSQPTLTATQLGPQSTETEGTTMSSGCRTSETQATTAQPVYQRVDAQDEMHQPDGRDAEIHNVAVDTSQRSPVPVVSAPVAICLATTCSQSSMGVLAPITVVLIALTIWSLASQQFIEYGKPWEKGTHSAAIRGRKANGLTLSMREHVFRLQSTALSGKTSVSRMVSMGRSLIAV